MYNIEQLPGRTALIDGEEWLYFSGTAYLGMVQDQDFLGFVAEGLRQYGVHYGGSRLAAIRLPLFEEAEAVLARITGAPAALIVSSGTVAGQLTTGQLLQGETRPFFAPRLHPALWPPSYSPTQKTFGGWSREVVQTLRQGASQKGGSPHSKLPMPLLLSDALDSLHVQSYDFSWLSELPREFPIQLVIDDSHGLGVCGPAGGGIYSQIQVPGNVELIVVSSLGKAFGIPGGVILGQPERLQKLRQSPHFGGASPVPPAFLHAFVQGQRQGLYRKNLRRLRRNVRLFKQLLPSNSTFQSFDEYPVFYTPEAGLATFLEQHHILISSFPYPTPEDDLITRVVINALHTEEDVKQLTRLVQSRKAEAGKRNQAG